MAKVQILPEVLAHKIAAGEIVERPASVVKELVENALDAAATQVLVEVEEGGRRLIAVRDDGTGMSPEDARLAFQHHATSKIRTFEDLSGITTLGFRGEALPSIASVSRLRLRTVEQEQVEAGAPLGTELRYEGGKLLEARELSWPRGSEICVEDLFFNVPARRKFLKSVPTEIGHLSRQVTHYALAYPRVEFQLHHQQRPILEAPAVDCPEDRIYQVLGETFLENLVPVDYEKEGVRVHGFTSLPHEQRSSTRWQYLYVNRRVVRDKVITHALRMAYQDLIPASSHPVSLLFVELDPSGVDVNVHPTKVEIRFQNSDKVHSAIYHGIEEALARHKGHLSNVARDVPLAHLRVREIPSGRQGVARSIERFFQRQPDSSLGFPQFRQTPSFQLTPSSRPTASLLADASLGLETASDPHRYEIPETAGLSPVPVILGQFVESFVVAADREGVMLIDQHVAHERILYDQALSNMNSEQPVPTQRLLLPLTLELTPQQKAVMEEIREELNQNGFEVDWFGERTIVVKGVPDIASKGGRIGTLLEQILDGLAPESITRSNGSRLRRLREKIAISVSCHAAIKINTPLTPEKMQWLVDSLFRCHNPYTCPHGRPIILRIGIEDVLRGFKRI